MPRKKRGVERVGLWQARILCHRGSGGGLNASYDQL